VPKDSVPIGTLRWRLTLANRVQTAESDNAGILENYVMLTTVYGNVQPIRPSTFWLAQATDSPVSHLIQMRWVSYLDNTQAVLRKTILRNGVERFEIFRVRRIKELGGRKRLVEIEAEFEQYTIN
jgi:head-tail adaptor